jgi:hypothetical protein
MNLNEISDHLEIRTVLAKYCRGVDRRDWELLRSVYHPDGTDNHGPFNGTGSAFADYLDESLRECRLTGHHQMTNVYIELDGDMARVESYYLVLHPLIDPQTKTEALLQSGGRYLDKFEKRNGAWKIASRVCTVDWSRFPLPGNSWAFEHFFPKVGPRGCDASDELFGVMERAP